MVMHCCIFLLDEACVVVFSPHRGEIARNAPTHPPSLSSDQDKYTEYKERQDRGHGSAGDRAGPDRGSRPSGERDSRPAAHRDRDAAGRERAHRRPREDGHSAAR